jgi:hypothetical protein
MVSVAIPGYCLGPSQNIDIVDISTHESRWRNIDISCTALPSMCALYSAIPGAVKINEKYIENNAETQTDS